MKNPPKALEAALKEGKRTLELVVATSGSFYDEDSDGLEEAEDEYFEKYNDLVRQVKRSWGEPLFDNGYGTRGFPKWYEAQWLAYWEVGDCIGYVALRHDDQELPFLLVCGLREGIAKRPARRKQESSPKQLQSLLSGEEVKDIECPEPSTIVFVLKSGRTVRLKAVGGRWTVL